MRIEFLERTKTSIRFRIEAPVSFANALRRILLGEVSVPAIDLVEIRENNTVLADEMLAHRLGLIPISLARDLISKTDCDCDSYCDRCSVVLTLSERNASDRTLSVTGSSIKSEDGAVEVHGSLIVRLAPGQSVNVKCIVRAGSPQTHAKHSPVALVKFVYDPRNATRDTKLWCEEDPHREWPSINQDPTVDWADVNSVAMDVEVVETAMAPELVLLEALKIFREKMAGILRSLD